jgi:hypothetical protein
MLVKGQYIYRSRMCEPSAVSAACRHDDDTFSKCSHHRDYEKKKNLAFQIFTFPWVYKTALLAAPPA